MHCFTRDKCIIDRSALRRQKREIYPPYQELYDIFACISDLSPNSWLIRCHRTWTRELAVSTFWRWKIITFQLLMLLIRWTLEQPSEHLWQTVPHRSRHSCCACKSGIRWKRFFCVRPAYCWSEKQNGQVIATASLFETEQKSIGEHRH